jgi:hypothetical protein
MILAQREALMLAQSETQVGRLEIERLKLMLAKLRREQFGQSSERGKQLIEQLESHEAPVNCRPICQWNGGSSHSLAPVANAEVQGFTSSARPSPKRLNVNHAAGRLSAIAHVLIPGGVGIGQELAWLRKFDSGIAS